MRNALLPDGGLFFKAQSETEAEKGLIIHNIFSLRQVSQSADLKRRRDKQSELLR